MKLLAILMSASLLLASVSYSAGQQPKSDQDKSAATSPAAQSSSASLPMQAELEKKFQEEMSGTTLRGHFTNNRDTGGAGPKEDKYTIESVSKVKDDIWLFTARIQYGTHDVSLPLPLRVVWAGDTPVITLDKFPVPGMGSFTARIMIFNGEYAGMWDGGDHGGMMYGKITKENAKDNK